MLISDSFASNRAQAVTRTAVLVLAGFALTACAAGVDRGTADDGVAIIPEAFETPRDTADNVDSPAVWHGPDGQHWLLVTAKEGNVIRVSDARTGELLDRVGGTGDGEGELRRPNGIAVIDDLAIVVERDNARVQVFALPAFEPLGTFGEGQLKLPYGVALHEEAPGAYVAYITDAWEIADDVVPPDSLLDDRVHRFAFSVEEGALVAAHLGHFGDTGGPGVLHVVESIAIDVVHGRLMIAEEEEGDSKIMAYTLDGEFAGEMIEADYFPHQAEGIVLYACDDGAGYWIATDQGEETNTFHVFDRQTLEHRGSFRGETVLNTDGIALTQHAFDGFPAGAFFAVHDDQSTVAFSWIDIADQLGLRDDCHAPSIDGAEG